MFLATVLIFLSTFILVKVINFLKGDKKINEFAKKVPGPPLYPIIGNLPLFLGGEISFSKLMQNNYEKYGERFRFLVMNKAILVTSNLSDVEAIVGATSTKGDLYNLLKYYMGTSIFLNAAEEAKKKRRFLTPTFHASVLDGYFPALEDALKRLTKILDKTNGELVEVGDIIQRFTIDILTETSMGVRVNALENLDSEYITAFRTILDCYDIRWKNILYHSDFIYNRTQVRTIEKNAADLLSSFCHKIIVQRRNALENGEVHIEGKKVSFLDALLVLRDENGQLLDNDTIKYEVNGVMVAGHDTTFTTFANLAYHISIDPILQEKIYKEQIEVMGDDRMKTPSLEDTGKMKYLDMAIKEILRLYSSVPTIGRVATKDFKLADGLAIPEGTNIFLNLFNMGRNEKVFPDPLKFDPERWTPEKVAKRSNYASIPFSIGPRSCIGMSFAMWELKSLFSQVLRNYKMLPSGKPLELLYNLTLKPKSGMYLKFVKRN